MELARKALEGVLEMAPTITVPIHAIETLRALIARVWRDEKGKPASKKQVDAILREGLEAHRVQTKKASLKTVIATTARRAARS